MTTTIFLGILFCCNIPVRYHFISYYSSYWGPLQSTQYRRHAVCVGPFAKPITDDNFNDFDDGPTFSNPPKYLLVATNTNFFDD